MVYALRAGPRWGHPLRSARSDVRHRRASSGMRAGDGRPVKNLLVGQLNAVLMWLKRSRRVIPRQTPVYVNLGSSMTVAPGWMNIDGSPNTAVARLPVPILRLAYRFTGSTTWYSEQEYVAKLRSHQFVHHNLRYGVPLHDDIADAIFTSHFIEHLYHSDAVRLLTDCFRALKPGGSIRVCVPDLRIAVDAYLAGRAAEALDYFFIERNARTYDRHLYMYDLELLTQVLADCGFADIRRCSFREGSTPDLEVLDNRPEQTLYVEARKPSRPAAEGS